VPNHPYQHGFDLRLVPSKMMEPFTWPAASKVFVNSMSDLFHPQIPDSFIIQVARVMMQANWHTYQVLTKRSERLAEMLCGSLEFAANSTHIWWGVSVEDRTYGIPRIGHLQKAPAAVKFLSIEPLLEDLGDLDFRGLNWVIVGGESGRGARPIKEEWVLSLMRACLRDAVPFFFKQWGGVNKKKLGRTLNGRTYDELPALSTLPIPTKPVRQAMIAAMEKRFDTAYELIQLAV
jgi:protein gp37